MLHRALLSLLLTACAVTATAARPKHRPHHHPVHHPAHRVARHKAPGATPRAAANGILNADALAPFLTSLDSLKAPEPGRVVRILQFGDSHTAADYWSGRMRRRLQDRFGDGGPGWLLPGRPWRGYPHAGVRILNGQAWPAQSLRSADCDGWVGLPGASVLPVAGEDFRVQAAFGAFRVALLGPGGGTVSARLETPGSGQIPVSLEPPPLLEASESGAVPAPLPPPAGAAPTGPALAVPRTAAEVLQEGRSLEIFGLIDQPSAQPRELSLTLPPGASLLGVELLSGRPGIVYDELGLNGAEITDLERWNPALRRALLVRAAPDLIVLAYGTNDEGMALSAQAGYEQRLRTLLFTLRQEAGAPILLVGPLDRVGKRKRQRAALASGANWIIKAMTQACLESGCAFWDARRAMGGYGAILKWRRAGLAQKDQVHLNGAGYQRLGDLMADALLATYRTVK